jgi:hypothetical protein
LSATWSAQAWLIFASETLRRKICSSKVAKIQRFNGFRAVSLGGASPLYAVLPPEICLPQTANAPVIASPRGWTTGNRSPFFTGRITTDYLS